jgi:hypothetical protein
MAWQGDGIVLSCDYERRTSNQRYCSPHIHVAENQLRRNISAVSVGSAFNTDEYFERSMQPPSASRNQLALLPVKFDSVSSIQSMFAGYQR